MCIPIISEGKVKAVLQAMNKLKEPHFNPEEDARVMKLLGRVCLEVLKVCDSSSAGSVNMKRKDNLLLLFTSNLHCDTGAQLLQAFEQGLKELFSAQAAALHVLVDRHDGKQGFTRYQCDKSHGNGQRKVLKVPCDSLQGVAGQVARSCNTSSISWSQLHNSPHNPTVDLAVPERMVLHTLPLIKVATSGCEAVCQFLCPERDRAVVADDGVFQPENTAHFRLLNLLLTFVQAHLHVLDRRRSGIDSLDGEGLDSRSLSLFKTPASSVVG